MLTRAVGSGALVAIVIAAAPHLRAQSAPAPDFSNVEIHSLHVQGNVWMLVGGPFNAAVSIGNDGVLVVDTMVEPLADRLIAEVKKITAAPAILSTFFWSAASSLVRMSITASFATPSS